MYYIHISLYPLVIPPPLIPPIPPVVTSCSKGPWSFQGAPYIPSAPFIHIFVRRSTLASLANWSRLTNPCFFLPFHLGHFGRCKASSCLCASGKTLAWLGAPYHTWHFLFTWISPLWIPSPLISPLQNSSPRGRSSGHPVHPQSLYCSHISFWFLLYTYQIGSFPFIHRTSCTLCFLSSLSRPHDSHNLLFVILYITRFVLG